MNLEDAIADYCPADAPFEPMAYYSEAGDCIEFKASPEACDAVRIDGLLTVYYSAETGAIIGSKLNHVRKIVKNLPSFRLIVREGGKTRLDHLILSLASTGCEGLEKSYDVKAESAYRETLDLARNQEVNLSSIETASALAS